MQNELARFPLTHKQQGKLRRRDEKLSSIGAQEMETGGYQVSDLEEFRCHWEDLDFSMKTNLRRGVDTTCSPSTINDVHIGSMAGNPIPIDEKENKANSAPDAITAVCEQLNECPEMLTKRCLH